MKGEAIRAGSRPTFCTPSGSIQPISLAMTTAASRVTAISTPIMKSPYMIQIRTPLTTASTTPTSSATRNSFQTTRRISLGSISPRAMPRIIRVLDWLPQFPPVSISMGMKLTSSGMAANAAS